MISQHLFQSKQRPEERLAIHGTCVLVLLAALLLLPLTSAQAAGGDSITSPDTVGDVGEFTSLVLDSSGYPVVSYHDDTNGDLKLLRCNDPNCSGDDDSIVTIDSTGIVGWYTSLALDASGFPVVSYYDRTKGDLKLVRCNDDNCSGGDESIVTVDSGGDVGAYSSLALDSDGFPVISYYRAPSFDLKLAHCNDSNCTGGDESIVTVDSTGIVGAFTSLVLDSNGYPVVSYRDITNSAVKVLHCNDPNCAGGDESIEAFDNTGNINGVTSLALDSSGNPAVSYRDSINGDLKLLRCNDPNCTGGDESIVVVDSAGNVGKHSSLALDGSGYPVISYQDLTNNDLKLVRCNDSNCTGGDENIVTVDSAGIVGEFTSLVLDNNGYPVVSYYDFTNADLKLLRCDDPNCDNAHPTATNDAYSTEPDTTLTVTAPGVLTNDGDSDGDSLTALQESGPSNGTLTLNSDGSFTYTPSAGYEGDDQFTYRASDGRDNSNVATVSISVAVPCPAFPITVTSESELNEAIDCYNAVTSAGSYAINLGADIILTVATGSIDNVTAGVELLVNGGGFTVDGQDVDGVRPFTIAAGTAVTIDNITITRGASGSGGAIFNAGTLIVSNSTLDNNHVRTAPIAGGAVYNDATGIVTISGSTLSSNKAFEMPLGSTAGGAGAGIYSNGGTVNVNSSIIRDNVTGGTASDGGVGIFNANGGTVNISHSILDNNDSFGGEGGAIRNSQGSVTVTSSTMSNNYSGEAGGAIYNNDMLHLINSTLSNNSSSFSGGIYITPDGQASVINSTLVKNSSGGIYNTGQLAISNSIVSQNSGDPEIWSTRGGTVNADANNLFSHSGRTMADAFTGFTPGPNDIDASSDGTLPTALNSILDTTLQNNGGNSDTHALVPGSPAIDGGDNAICSAAPVNNLDQRGVVRLQGPVCDIGAFELENNPPVAADDAYGTDEVTPLNVAAPGVLANDMDADGDSLAAVLVGEVANGTLTLNADGSFSYMPNGGFTGDDSFTYVANDGIHKSNTATVVITVNAVNHPPVCEAATPSVSTLWPPNGQFHPINIDGITDADDDPITLIIDAIFQDEPVDGEADGQGVGTATAALRAERLGNGNGRFYHVGFTASDGNGGSCSGTVQVSVPKNMGKKGAAVDDGPSYDSTDGSSAVSMRRALLETQSADATQPQLFLPLVSSK